ncbi:MAG: hypothetical protein U5L96_14840 [Owenweeksia sp.]|nr:hypothetical protein [Owenweeksia sp.]
MIILVIGAGVTTLVFSTEPTAKRAGATKKTAMLVEVVEVNRGTFSSEGSGNRGGAPGPGYNAEPSCKW